MAAASAVKRSVRDPGGRMTHAVRDLTNNIIINYICNAPNPQVVFLGTQQIKHIMITLKHNTNINTMLHIIRLNSKDNDSSIYI